MNLHYEFFKYSEFTTPIDMIFVNRIWEIMIRTQMQCKLNNFWIIQ